MTVGLEKINLVALAELVEDMRGVCGSTGKLLVAIKIHTQESGLDPCGLQL